VSEYLIRCRYDGWVTELKDQKKVTNVSEASGIDNLLYSSDVDFSCFADLAVVSPVDYRKQGEGSLMQVVITPCEKYMPMSNAAIAAEMHKQVQKLFPSARGLTNTWHSVVKVQQSLYRCASCCKCC
jgi:zeta-carotene desaturase